MKNWLLLPFFCFFILAAYSQDDDALYRKNKSIPSFELQLTDNAVFTKVSLKKNTPLILMYFSPTCDHCIHQTEAMLKRMKDLSKFQIVMATYQPIEDLREFNKKYQLKKYPNITTGRDTKYALPPFFEIRNFPYLAFYDKKGVLLSIFEGTLAVDDVLERFK